jgi:hypothetical protein
MAETGPVKVDDIFPKEIASLGSDIEKRLAADHVAGRQVGWNEAGGDALGAIRDSIKFDLFREIAGAWVTAHGLLEYADPEKHAWGVDYTYALGENRVELKAEPVVTIALGPIEAPPITFGYGVEADFDGVVLTIRDGAISHAELGKAAITGVLSLEGQNLHKPCTLAQGRIPAKLDFDPPIPIPKLKKGAKASG